MSALPDRLDVLLYYPFMGRTEAAFFEVHHVEHFSREDMAVFDAYNVLDAFMRAREPGMVLAGALAEHLTVMLERMKKDQRAFAVDVVFIGRVNLFIQHCSQLVGANALARPIGPIARPRGTIDG